MRRRFGQFDWPIEEDVPEGPGKDL